MKNIINEINIFKNYYINNKLLKILMFNDVSYYMKKILILESSIKSLQKNNLCTTDLKYQIFKIKEKIKRFENQTNSKTVKVIKI